MRDLNRDMSWPVREGHRGDKGQEVGVGLVCPPGWKGTEERGGGKRGGGRPGCAGEAGGGQIPQGQAAHCGRF